MKTIRAILLTAVIISTAMPVHGYSYHEIRDGKLFIRSTGAGEAIRIDYSNAWNAATQWDEVYLQAPDGALLDSALLGPTRVSGTLTHTLDAGAGDYILSFASYTFRKFKVTIPDGVKAVYQPPKFYMNFHVGPGFDTFYFKVEPGTPAFTVLGKKELSSALTSLSVYDPSGAAAGSFDLPEATYSAYYPYNSHRETSPAPGFWKAVIGYGSSGNTKVSFWLDEIPNYFCLDTAHWFIPVHKPGKSTLTAVGVCGPAGMIGGEMGGNPITKVMENVRDMGLESNNYYISHKNREPVNDNADPNTFNWSAFSWNDDSRMETYTGIMEMIGIFAPAEWLGKPVVTSADMHELAEFYEAYLIHHNAENGRGIKYLTPIDEPNLQNNYTKEGFAQLASIMGQRKNSSQYPEVRDSELLVLASSRFSCPSPSTGNSGAEWAEYIYRNHDADVDGITFHVWNERDLLSSWRFAEEVKTAHRIIADNDTDGDTLETIIIDQTNINSGSGSSPYYVNSMYAALWWTGAVCRTLNTGRVTSINWLTTVDDDHHKKGLMYGAEKSYALKPVGYATKFLIENKLDSVISTTLSHPETDALVTISGDRSAWCAVVSNKGRRTNECTLSITLPAGFTAGFDVEVTMIDSTNGTAATAGTFTCGSPPEFTWTLAPRTIYAFRGTGSAVAIRSVPPAVPGTVTGSLPGFMLPNPCSIARLAAYFAAGKDIRLFTAQGKRIHRASDLAPGIYFLQGSRQTETGRSILVLDQAAGPVSR